MSEMNRYKFHMFDRYPADGSGERETHAEMRKSDRGDYVKFGDVEVLISENRLLRHDLASYLEKVAKLCDMLSVDLESAKSSDGKPSDVLFGYITSLQQRLTAADELVCERTASLLECGTRRKALERRADVLVDLLTHAHIAIHTMEPGFFLLEKIDAALKPAEGGGDEAV